MAFIFSMFMIKLFENITGSKVAQGVRSAMRRVDREVTDFLKMTDIMKNCGVLPFRVSG